MSKKKRAALDRTAAAGAHVERATSVLSGLPIFIRCECPLGRDHTYAEWEARFGAEVFRG